MKRLGNLLGRWRLSGACNRLLVLGCVWLAGLLPASGQVSDAQKFGVVKIISRSSSQPPRTGAGFVVQRSGNTVTIITAAHVVAAADDASKDDISVQFYGLGRAYPAAVRHIEVNNVDSGMALLLVTAELPAAVAPLPLNADLRLGGGEPVHTVGHQPSTGEWGVLTGTVANRTGRVLRIQVPVAPQASGGPVLHQGAVVGLVMQTDPARGFGQAVPAEDIRSYAQGVPGALAGAPSSVAAAQVGAGSVGTTPSPAAERPAATEPRPPVITASSAPRPDQRPDTRADGARDCAECPEMVMLVPGNYAMGSTGADPDDRPSEQPRHEVRITAPFAIGRSEVTRGEFAAFVQATGYLTEAERGDGCGGWNGQIWERARGRTWRDPGLVQTALHPVVCVSWNDAQAYVRWLAQRTGKAFRLPTEAEWEFAARAAVAQGAVRSCESINGADASTRQLVPGARSWPAAACNDGYGSTAPVDGLADGRLGLRHMQGNVAEWVQDAWHENYAGAPLDGSEWTLGADATRRVVRGGSWADPPRDVRVVSRDWYLLDARDTVTGFRVMRTP